MSGAWLFWEPLFVPDPQWVVGAALATVGTGAVLASRVRGWRDSAWLIALVFGAQFLALQALYRLSALHHGLPGVTPLLLLVGKFLGLPVTAEHGVLFFQTEEEVLPFVTNWEKVGLIMPASLLVAIVVVTLQQDRRLITTLRHLLWGAALLLAYTLLRYLALCGWLIEFGDPKGASDSERLTLFTSSWIILATYLPFVLMAGRTGLGKLAGAPGSGATAPRKTGEPPSHKRGLAAFAGGVALALVAFNIALPGTAKPGRIVVDDSHSGFWEPSLPNFDTHGFGSGSLYNCSSLLEYLRYFHQVRVNTSHPLDEELLRDCEVLVLKTPSRRYTSEEVAAMVAFVRRGGGLLLIGDHTNLLGMSSFLNELASNFGIEFRYDASNTYSTGYFSSFRPYRLFAHPIVQGLPQVNFLTTCTLRHPLASESVMLGHDLLSDPIDYSKPSFFGKLVPTPKNGFGLFALAVARRFGQGRVVAFADSTGMSNFAAFQDGTASFYLRMIEYLNQTNGSDRLVKWCLGGAAALLLAWGLWRLAAGGIAKLCATCVAGGLTGYLAAGLALVAFNVWSFPPARPIRPPPRIAYLAGPHFNYDIPPAIGPSYIPLEEAFDGLFVMPQRFGIFPLLTNLRGLDRDRFSSVVAINPRDDMPADEIVGLTRFMSGGGRLLVFDEPPSSGAVVRTLAAGPGSQLLFERTFALPPLITNSFAFATNVPLAAADLSPTNAAALLSPRLITNSMVLPPLLAAQLRTNTVKYSAWKVGSGKLYVVSSSAMFSRFWLGNVMGEPSEPQRRAYEAAFEVFRKFLEPCQRPE